MDVTFHVSSNHGDFVMAQTNWKQVNLSTIEGEVTTLLEVIQMV